MLPWQRSKILRNELEPGGNVGNAAPASSSHSETLKPWQRRLARPTAQPQAEVFLSGPAAFPNPAVPVTVTALGASFRWRD
jgi:hypothetical protein